MMNYMKGKATNAFLTGVEWVLYTRSVLGYDKKNHDYKIIATATVGLTTYVKYEYLGKEYIVIQRDPTKSIEDIFPIYPPVHENLDANVPVIVTNTDGDDLTDKALMFAGPKGNFYIDTPYYVRLGNISEKEITIMDSNCEEHTFTQSIDVIRIDDISETNEHIACI